MDKADKNIDFNGAVVPVNEVRLMDFLLDLGNLQSIRKIESRVVGYD